MTCWTCVCFASLIYWQFLLKLHFIAFTLILSAEKVGVTKTIYILAFGSTFGLIDLMCDQFSKIVYFFFTSFQWHFLFEKENNIRQPRVRHTRLLQRRQSMIEGIFYFVCKKIAREEKNRRKNTIELSLDRYIVNMYCVSVQHSTCTDPHYVKAEPFLMKCLSVAMTDLFTFMKCLAQQQCCSICCIPFLLVTQLCLCLSLPFSFSLARSLAVSFHSLCFSRIRVKQSNMKWTKKEMLIPERC